MDRFIKGLVSGMIGGVTMDLWGFLSKDILGISTRNYVDWASVLIYGFLPEHWYQSFQALLTHLLWTGFLGIIFSFLLLGISSEKIHIKGILFGFIVGFFSYSAAILLRMPYFAKIPFQTSISTAIGGILWGFVTAHVRRYLDSKNAT